MMTHKISQLFTKLSNLFFRMKNNNNNNNISNKLESLRNNYLKNPEEYWKTKGLQNQSYIFNGNLLEEDIVTAYMHTFLNIIKECSPSSILEAGAGYGRVIRFLRDNLPSIKYFAGSDLSPSQIQTALKLESQSRSNKTTIDYTVADTCNLPYANSKFDVVYTYGSLTHIPPSSIENAVRELLRVVKNYLIICEVHSKKYAKNIKIAFVHPYIKLAQGCGATLEELVTENVERKTLNYKLYVFKKHKED